MTTRDYSQSKEQEVILQWAAERELGAFLDIGAGDGQTFSNTRALALAGWWGVVVEPAAWAFDRLSKLYYGTEVECVSAVVTAASSGLLPFYSSREDHLSTLEFGHTKQWPTVDFERVTMSAVTLHELLDYFGIDFSFVNIDAEGTTIELLSAYTEHPSWEEVHCVCIEAEDGVDRAEILAMSGWTRLAITDNNVVLWR